MSDDAAEYAEWDLRRIPIPDDVELAITTPHDHESLTIGGPNSIYAGQPHSRALWLIWKRVPLGRFGTVTDPGAMDYPQLDSVV